MIRSVHVKSFKSLRDVKLDLGLVNVFIGPNGAGKSNLLEALGVLSAAVTGRVDDEALLRRGVRPGVPDLYLSSFRRRKQPKELVLRVSGDGADLHVALGEPSRPGSTAWSFEYESLNGEDGVVANRPRGTTRHLDPEAGLVALAMVEIDPESSAGTLVRALREFAIYTPTTSVLRGLVPEPQRIPIGLAGGRLAEAFREVLETTDRAERGDYFRLVPWAKGVRVRPADKVRVSSSVTKPDRVLTFVDRFMAEERNELTAYDASEGALFVLFAMVAALHPAMPPVFAVDNFDHGVHPVLARALAEQVSEWVLENRDRQILFTAHNPVLLDGLPIQDPEVRLFVVSRLANGETDVRRLEITPALLALAQRGKSLSRMWIDGDLGGVPVV